MNTSASHRTRSGDGEPSPIPSSSRQHTAEGGVSSTNKLSGEGRGRTLVLCFDGTSGEYDDDNTNVIKFFSLLPKDDPEQQITYYQPGIGTWFNPGIVAPMFEWGAKLLDAAFAVYLDAHVLSGYRFLMQNYRKGDKICIFGFSRGAYTARALAGVLHKVGLLPRDNGEQIPFAYKLYKREDEEGIRLAAGFKQAFCQSVKVEFMGVWDTVAAVGVLMIRTLPFTNFNSSIKVFRHALSLDEHRARFRPNAYHRPVPPTTTRAAKTTALSVDSKLSSKNIPADTDSRMSSDSKLADVNIEQLSADDNREGEIGTETDKPRPKSKRWSSFWNELNKPKLKLKSKEPALAGPVVDAGEGINGDVLEVWFAGSHGDVGGGNVPNTQPRALSNIPLRWMVRQVMACGCGIRFDEAALERLKIPLHDPLSAIPASPTEASAEEAKLNSLDALEPIYDALVVKKVWWILEIMFLYYSWQDEKGVWHSEYSMNLGKGRIIRDPKPKFHITVKQRMEAPGLGYTPKAKWAGEECYVS